MEAVCSGMERHGHAVDRHNDFKPRPCDLAVTWSHKRREINAASPDVLVIERGYLGDRMNTQCSLGFNGLNGRADFQNEDVPDDRGQRWLHLLQPYHNGGYVVIMGQVPGDAALTCVLQEFVNQAKAGATAHGLKEHRILFRPHPGAVNYPINGMSTIGGSLDVCLSDAYWAITHSSNSAVDAALAGVRVTALDRGSMAWDIASHDYTPVRPTDAERIEWLNRLAYCQWTIDEIANGEAWDHLKARYQ